MEMERSTKGHEKTQINKKKYRELKAFELVALMLSEADKRSEQAQGQRRDCR